MRIHVPLQVLLCGKTLPTVLISTRVDFGSLIMHMFNVCFEVAFTKKSFSAMGTNKGSIFFMYVHVLLQATGSRECSSASFKGTGIDWSWEDKVSQLMRKRILRETS